MRLFEGQQVLDLDPYILVLQFQLWVLDVYEISVEHTRHWYFKDPPLPGPANSDLVGALAEPIVPYLTPPITPMDSSQAMPRDDWVDLTSDDEEE